MDWLQRAVGCVVVATLLAISAVALDVTLDRSADSDRAGAVAADGGGLGVDVVPATTVPTGERDIPDYLALVPGVSTGSHRVISGIDGDDTSSSIPGLGTIVEIESDGMAPGLYASSFDSADCTYNLYRDIDEDDSDDDDDRRLRRSSDNDDESDRPVPKERLIGSDSLREGRMLVSINEYEPDRFYSTTGCEDWVSWQPLTEPLTTAYNGDYWIGDLAKGTWLVPDGCYWEEVVGFRGANLNDAIDSGNGPVTIEVDSRSAGFRVRMCTSPMRLTDAS